MDIRVALIVNVVVALFVAECGGHSDGVSTFGSSTPGLSSKFYARSCPKFEGIVDAIVRNDSLYEAQMPAHLIRLLWHDCAVQGCDASVMLASTPTIPSERQAPDNQLFGLMKGGYNTVNAIKARLEAVCPQMVSCADIIAAAAKSALVVAGGPKVSIRYGRRDSITSFQAAPSIVLPHEDYTPGRVVQTFQRLGLSVADMVALIGTHTIGTANCWKFYSRINGTFDPRLAPEYAAYLNKTCVPPAAGSTGLWPWLRLDNVSGTTFDNQFYKNLKNGYGLLNTDAGLMDRQDTKSLVDTFAKSQSKYFKQYAKSFLKLSELNVLLAPQGEIRVHCESVLPDASK